MNHIYYNGRQYEIRAHKELGLEQIEFVDVASGKVLISMEFKDLKCFVANVVRDKKIQDLIVMNENEILGLL